jgi:hypothetical protein
MVVPTASPPFGMRFGDLSYTAGADDSTTFWFSSVIFFGSSPSCYRLFERLFIGCMHLCRSCISPLARSPSSNTLLFSLLVSGLWTYLLFGSLSRTIM